MILGVGKMDMKKNLAFQALLYKKPLYEYIGKNEVRMNVLVLGYNEYVAAFIDQCLQAGQMDSHELNITVLYKNALHALHDYLKERRELAKFVNVNGSLNETELQSYGTLNFTELETYDELLQTNEEADEEILLNILSAAPDEKYHYFVVAFDDDVVNKKIANKLHEVVEELELSETSTIHYVCRDCADDNIPGLEAIPVDLYQDISEIDPDLDRIAFNVHLSWADSINGDCKTEYNKFKENKYNYFASVAFALSIKYKLADIGIDISEGAEISAKKFHEKLSDEGNVGLINHIIALEHRRWVLEKLVANWKGIDKEKCDEYYADCIERCNVKDEARRIHPCIVRSTTDTPLSTGVYASEHKYWDEKSKNDIDLDELDLISVNLHRKMLSAALVYKKRNPLHSEEFMYVSQLLAAEPKGKSVSREWNRFEFCLKNILDGNWAYSKQYDRYKKAFQNKIALCSETCRSEIEKIITNLDHDIFPVIEYNLFRDYKLYDEVLVKKIPFILTYKVGISLATVFQSTTSLSRMNDTIFRNVASATVIKPGKLTFLLYLDDNVKREIVKRMIQIVSKYLKGKGIECIIQFLIAGQNSVHKEQESEWRKCFENLRKNGTISEFSFELTDTEMDAIKMWVGLIAQEKIDLFDGTSNAFQSMKANGELLKSIQSQYPYFEFESRTKHFRNNPQCEYLSYIEDHTYLGIEEMFGLAGALDMEFNYPVLGNDYKELWSIYIGKNRGTRSEWQDNIRYSVKGWNILCDTLEKYDEQYHKEIVNIEELKASYQGYYKWSDILLIIRELSGEQGGKKFFIPEIQGGKLVAFSYLNDDVKRVLTKGGEILEIYSYYQVCETDYFDEVACGYRFRWNGDINNELDLVLTKGFSSIIVECKARTKLDQNFYFKLNSLVDIFGIGTKKVLLTTAKTNEGDNKMQSERGTMMGIATISEIDDIQKISERLYKLL